MRAPSRTAADFGLWSSVELQSSVRHWLRVLPAIEPQRARGADPGSRQLSKETYPTNRLKWPSTGGAWRKSRSRIPATGVSCVGSECRGWIIPEPLDWKLGNYRNYRTYGLE